MGKLWILPLEDIEMRYTAQWRKWVADTCKRRGVEYEMIDGDTLKDHSGKIETGQFLDAHATNYWKLTQMARVVEKLYDGQMDHGDKVFDFDIWHTGIQALPYITAITGQKIDLYGILHSGTYDPTEYITRAGMHAWGSHFENAILSHTKAVFVGTPHHANIVDRAGMIIATGLPYNSVDVLRMAGDLPAKENKVVWPSRLSAEKNPHTYQMVRDRVKATRSDVEFVATHEHSFSKREYYRELASAKVVLSTASHENFGIGVVEGMTLQCLPVVPVGACYDAYVPDVFMCRSSMDAVYRILKIMESGNNDGTYGNMYKRANIGDYVRKYDYSVDAMLNAMGYAGV